MKIREGGMPDEGMWESFFDPDAILMELDIQRDCKTVVDFGSGYGTFTIPAAKKIAGVVYGLEIEDDLVAECSRKARSAGLTNVICQQRDLISMGTGLDDNTADYVMLFNILHTEQPLVVLREAFRILVPTGKVGVIHWNFDPSTPRGPSMDIRPQPEQCQEWIRTAGFKLIKPYIDLPPYHYGMVGQKP